MVVSTVQFVNEIQQIGAIISVVTRNQLFTTVIFRYNSVKRVVTRC